MPTSGVRLAVDYGQTRIGIAKSDPHALMAFPVTTINNSDSAIEELTDVIRSTDAVIVYVGNPINLKAEPTLATVKAQDFAVSLDQALSVQGFLCEVRILDERFSTRTAQTQLRDSGKNSKNSKGIIDQAAAIVILEHALATERSTGQLAGQLVSDL